MKIEVRISMRPFIAIIRARIVRPCSEIPRVKERNIGVLPIVLTIGNSAPTTRRVFVARSLSAPPFIAPIIANVQELALP